MTETADLPITLVMATKLPASVFLSKSATDRSICRFASTTRCNVQLYAENSTGLGELYNKAINQAIAQDDNSRGVRGLYKNGEAR